MNHKFLTFQKSVSLKKFLSKKLPNNKSVFRYNFHKNNNDKDQLMMIWQRKNYFYPPKKFLDTSKTYVLLSGRLNLYILNPKGKIIKLHRLDKSDQICKIKKDVYHIDVAKSKIAIHCEITNHSFNDRKMKFLNKKNFLKIKKLILKSK